MKTEEYRRRQNIVLNGNNGPALFFPSVRVITVSERCLYDTVPYRKKSVTVRTVLIALWYYERYVSAAFFVVNARAAGAFYGCMCFLSIFISSVFGLPLSPNRLLFPAWPGDNPWLPFVSSEKHMFITSRWS